MADSDADKAGILVSTVSPLFAGIVLANEHRIAEDFAVGMPSIVPCADIAGFSIAWAELARSGERGAKDLRRIVSNVFDPVADVKRAAGGQIL
jgi:hypothetical protein